MDGLTGGQQDRLMAKSKTDPHLMMFSLNFWASLYLLIRMLYPPLGIRSDVRNLNHEIYLSTSGILVNCSRAMGQWLLPHVVAIAVTS